MPEKVVINSSRVVQEVTIVSQPNITKVYINNQNGGGGSITGQNNTWREVYLGSYTDGNFSYEQLFDQELIVSETENIMLVFSKLDNSEEDLGVPPILYRYKFARGKGTWNPIPHVIGTDIIFESSLAPNSGDIDIITGGPNTQTYDIGDITGTDIWDFVTANGPYDMSNPALTYLFLSVTDGITYLHQFIGTNGVYGTGETPAAESDFLLITTSTTIPVTYNLKVNETGEAPLEFINQIEFDGATVTSDGPNKAKVTITGGGEPTIEKLFTVDLATIGASDITDVDDVRTKLRDYTIAEGLTKPADELHRWEVVEELPVAYTLTLKSSDWGSVVDSVTFQTFLEGLGLTDVVITDFSLVSDLLSCNLVFTGTTLDLSTQNLTEIINIDAFAQLTQLVLADNSISVLCSFDSMVNLNSFYIGTNDITTAEWNKLATWVPLSAATGTISTSPNTNSFATSTTYTLLAAKGGWIIS